MTDAMRTMLIGMVILMVPAFAVCVAITVVAVRRRHAGPEAEPRGREN